MTYVYPLPAKQWTTSRTDQGVDFVNKSASSQILAIGNARILRTGAPGWPAEGGVLYELLDGPAKGRVVYAYENVAPQVHAGQVVKAGQVIATMKGTGYPWLEMGWADAAGVPISHGEYSEGDETQGGKAFKSFIDRLPKVGSRPGDGRIPSAAEESGAFGSGLPGEKTFENTVGAAGHQVLQAGAGVVQGAETAAELGAAVVGALENPESLVLNIALVGGGAFLVYYGAALMLGVHRPAAAAVAPITKGLA